MDVYILTSLPLIFSGFLQEGTLRVAQEKKRLWVHIVHLRDFTKDKHRKIDDRPYGGGPGMILKVDPIYEAYQWVLQQVRRDTSENREVPKLGMKERGVPPYSPKTILLSPTGIPFTQKKARELSLEPTLVFICGRYEGVDERVKLLVQLEEISIGSYLLSGGEVATMVLLEAITRLIPGVVGNPESLLQETFESYEREFPQYTRPRAFQGLSVPDILLKGNHQEIHRWREQHMVKKGEEPSGPSRL